MANIIKIHVKISNPSWHIVFKNLRRQVIILLIPLLRVIYHSYQGIQELLEQKSKDYSDYILIVLAVPVGLLVLAVLFGMPVFFIFLMMGWVG